MDYQQSEVRRGGLDIFYVIDQRDKTDEFAEADRRSKLQIMRVDVGIWSKKKLLQLPKQSTAPESPSSDNFESHWLRFEKFMGDKSYLGTSTEHRSFMLTDIDYMMGGNTFYKWPLEEGFSFRNM